jgi:phage-related protein
MSLTLAFSPSPDGTSEDVSNKVRTAQFGDGYAQRVLDGINTKKRVWSVTFALPKASMDIISDFLDARKGTESFIWVPPYGSTGKWICASWRKAVVGALEYSISGQFTEVFGD